MLKVNRAGVDFALRLQLNVQQDQYYGSLRDSAGFKVMVHDQDEPALINELGFAIQPGTHTFCSLRKMVVSVTYFELFSSFHIFFQSLFDYIVHKKMRFLIYILVPKKMRFLIHLIV